MVTIVLAGLVLGLLYKLVTLGQVNAGKMKAGYVELYNLYNAFEMFRLENGCTEWGSSGCASVTFSDLVARSLIPSSHSNAFDRTYQVSKRGEHCVTVSIDLGRDEYAEDMVQRIESDGNDHVRAARDGTVLKVTFWSPGPYATSSTCH